MCWKAHDKPITCFYLFIIASPYFSSCLYHVIFLKFTFYISQLVGRKKKTEWHEEFTISIHISLFTTII
jgi:hypothetical protein